MSASSLPNSRNTSDAVGRDVARLRSALKSDLENYPLKEPPTPHLVVLSGLPGTGKSHFARELSERLPVVIVGSDRMRKALVARPKYTRSEHKRVFTACHRLIEELLEEGYRVVFDATNLTEGFRVSLYDIAERTAVPMTLVWFTAPAGLIKKRLDGRAGGRDKDGFSDADWSVYHKLRPGAEPITRPHLRVDSSRDVTPYLDLVLQTINSSASPINS